MGTVKPRKATFMVISTTKHGRVFAPVNKRAKFVARRLGVRTKITVQALKASQSVGSYKFYFYDSAGQLKPIKF